MSAAASALLRALITRSGVSRDRILLTEVSSTDWQSLTLVGERHRFELRVTSSDAAEVVDRICSGIEDAEFNIPRQIVADIEVVRRAEPAADGSITVTVDALTVEE